MSKIDIEWANDFVEMVNYERERESTWKELADMCGFDSWETLRSQYRRALEAIERNKVKLNRSKGK